MSPAPPADADADAELLRRVAEGDHGAALGALYDRYAGRLFGLGVRLLHDRGLAEELVQETFVRVWRAAAGFDPAKGEVRAWVFTIARRVAADLHHRRPAHETSRDAPDAGAPDARFDALVLELTVRDAMTALSDEHREALELAFHEDLTQPQIAARLDVPLGTVKSRTHHALRALRTELEQRGIDA